MESYRVHEPSQLEKDLELSSSEEESDVTYFTPRNDEDDRLDQPVNLSVKVQPVVAVAGTSTSANFPVAAVTQQMAGLMIKFDEPQHKDTQAGVGERPSNKSSSKMINLRTHRVLVNSANVDLGLDEIIANKKKPSSKPIIIPPISTGIRKRPKPQTLTAAQAFQRAQKLQTGVQTLLRENKEEEKIQMMEVPKYEPDPWLSLQSLMVKQGVEVLWTLKRFQGPETEQVDRRFRCCVELFGDRNTHSNISGLCEAPTPMLAKQGAASSFLHKLAERQKRFKRFKASVSPSTLVDRRVIDSLYGKLREKYKRDRVPIEMHPDKQTYNNRVVYLWNVRIGLEIFQGLSYRSRVMAKVHATEKIYEKVFQEPIPMMKIFLDDDCSDESLYEIYESEAFHHYKM